MWSGIETFSFGIEKAQTIRITTHTHIHTNTRFNVTLKQTKY